MNKKLKKALCLLVAVAASGALMISAQAEQVTEPVSQTRAAALSTPKITKLENTASGIKITWGKVSGAAKYRVYVKSGSDWKALTNTTGTSYIYKSAVSGEKYTFTIRCTTADGKSYTSSYNTKGWSQTYIAQPSISTLENRVTGVKLTWDSVPGAERYRIYAREAGGEWDYVGNTMGNTFTYIWTESGGDYSFTICCANKDNDTITSSRNEAGWGITYIGQPRVTKMESTEDGIKLSWDKISGAVKYRVQIKDGDTWKTVGTSGTNSFTYPGAVDGRSYTFTVACVNEDNTQVLSSFYENGWTHTYVQPETVVLDTPEITDLQSVDGGMKITWGAVSGAARYRVYVKEGDAWRVIGTSTGNSFVYKNATPGVKHTFTIRCVNDANTRPTSDYNNTGWSATHYLATPEVSKLESTADGMKITWGAVNGAEKYRVYVEKDGKWKLIGTTTDTSFTYKKAEAGKKDTYNVRCVNSDNTVATSRYSSTGWSATFYLATPEIKKLGSTTNGMKITWDAVNGAAKYRVYVKQDGKWKLIGTTSDTSFTYQSAIAGKKYSFTLRCVNADGGYTSLYNTKGWSATYYLATPGISKLESASDGMKITWKAVDGAERYRVYIKAGSGWKQIGTTTGTSFLYKDAVFGTKYTFTLRCVDASDSYTTSMYDTAGRSATHYLASPEITRIENTANGLKLTWGAVSGAQKYRVFVKTSSGWKTLGFTTGTSYEYKAAQRGETYTFTVRCVDPATDAFSSDFNTKGWSGQRYLETPQITKLSNTSEGVKLTWGAVSGAQKYRVFVKTSAGWKTLGFTTGTSFVFKDAKSGQKYFFTVRCVDAAGESFTSDYNTTGWSIIHK